MYITLIVSHLVFHATDHHISFLAGAFEGVIALAFELCNASQTAVTITSRISTILSFFSLSALLEYYACCGKCCAIYPMINGKFPERCTAKTLRPNRATKRAMEKQVKKQTRQLERKLGVKIHLVPPEPDPAGPSDQSTATRTTTSPGPDKSPSNGSSHGGNAASICDEPLTIWQRRAGSGQPLRPRREFAYQPIKEWLGRLMARPGMEEMMDNTVRCMPGKRRTKARDIWDASYVQDLRWPQPDGEKFFSISDKNGEGRLLFSLAIDWFNANHSGPAKKTWSIGAIYLACLNLPPSIRFRRENICLIGIIPGPKKPHGTQIDHFMQPLAEELLQFWTTGIWYEQTALHPKGRRIRGALGPLVCDLDACRAIAGFTSHSSRLFCSYCHLEKDKMTDLNKPSWKRRTNEEHRKAAERWKNADSLEEQDELFQENGVRWTPLLLLPYWNPIECTILDVMHNQFLGNLQRHFRVTWGLSFKVAGGDGSKLVMTGKIPTDDQMDHARDVLTNGKLKSLLQPELELLCLQHGLAETLGGRRTRAVMIEALERFVSDI